MALPNVFEQIKDGGLGLAAPALARVFGAVGNCSKGTVEQIYAFNDPDTLEDTLGQGTLVDQLLSAFANGARRVKAVRCDVTGGTAADPGTVVDDVGNTGTGTAEATGTPTNDRDFRAVCTVSGGVGTAKVKLSYDGGVSYGEELLLVETLPGPPKAAELDLGNGSKIKFTDAITVPEGSFVVNDAWTWQCSEAKPTTEKRLDAIDVIVEDLEIWWVHVTDVSDETDWASISTLRGELLTKHVYLDFLMEGDRPGAAETTDQWVIALQASSAGFYDYGIAVNAGWLLYVDRNGYSVIRNGAGIVSGLRASKSKVCESIGWVRGYPVRGALGLFPTDLKNSHIETLDIARYVTFRFFQGYGYRVTNARQMATETSDYRYGETVETVFKAVRLVRTAAMPYIEALADEAGLIAYQKSIESPLEMMLDDGEITGYELSIPPGQDIHGTGEVKAYLTIIPVAIMRKLTIEFALSKPKTT